MLVEISLTLCNSVICYRFICVKYNYTRDPFKESQNWSGSSKTLLFGSKYFSFVSPHLSYTGNKNCNTWNDLARIQLLNIMILIKLMSPTMAKTQENIISHTRQVCICIFIHLKLYLILICWPILRNYQYKFFNCPLQC